jgi:hypothetical protein
MPNPNHNPIHRHVLAHHVVHHQRHVSLLHRLLHPNLRRHIHLGHLGSLNVTVGAWQLLLWALAIPLGWALYHFIYRRVSPRWDLAIGLLASVVLLQLAAFVSFAVWRNGDVLFSLLWLSLIALLAGVALLPQLRFRVPRPTRPQQSGVG